MLGSNYTKGPEEFDSILQSVVNRSPDRALALSVAGRFENIFGKFGFMLRDIVDKNK
jgi:hypothetical protein